MEYFNTLEQTDWRISTCCMFHDAKLAKMNMGTTTRTTAESSGGSTKLIAKAIYNSEQLIRVMTHISTLPINLRSFRISSELFPCFTISNVYNQDEFRDKLRNNLFIAGKIAKENKIRISTHPGQYTVLGSKHKEVVINAMADLEYHAQIGAWMGLPAKDYTVNIHLQGLYTGTHEEGISRFATNYQYLSDYAQNALAVENEDKPGQYDIEHTLELSTRIPIRCTLDVHHYMTYRNKQGSEITCNDGYFAEAVKTWKDIRPLFHMSQSIPGDSNIRKHSDLFHDKELLAQHVPSLQWVDFDCEAKHKEQAVLDFYSFIKEEEQYAGEKIKTRRI